MYQPYEFTSPVIRRLHFVDADGVTQKTLALAARDAERYDVILATNDDTVSRTFVVQTTDGSTAMVLGEVTVPAGSGYAGVAPVDVLATLLPALQQFMTFPTGFGLVFNLVVGLAGGKNAIITAFGGEF